MGIILANGDSFTYGDELDGSRSPDGIDTHHHHTYVYKLSALLDRKYVNLGVNGASNMKIYRRTFDFLMSDNREIDLLVIMWSNFGRFEICEPYELKADKKVHIHREADMNQIIPNHHTSSFSLKNFGPHLVDMDPRFRILSQYVSKILTFETQIAHTLSYMTHIQFLCDKLDIPVIQGVIHGDMYKNILHTLRRKSEGFDDYKAYVTEKLRYLRPECKIGLGHYKDIYYMGAENNDLRPMGHSGEDTHTQFAEMLKDIIVERKLNVTN